MTLEIHLCRRRSSSRPIRNTCCRRDTRMPTCCCSWLDRPRQSHCESRLVELEITRDPRRGARASPRPTSPRAPHFRRRACNVPGASESGERRVHRGDLSAVLGCDATIVRREELVAREKPLAAATAPRVRNPSPRETSGSPFAYDRSSRRSIGTDVFDPARGASSPAKPMAWRLR